MTDPALEALASPARGPSAVGDPPGGRRRRFARYAWGAVAVTVPVILWGAWVRISHSGAGCGEHWPTCHGSLIPEAPARNTIIEFVHRATSGLVLVVFGLLVFGAWRAFGRGHRVWRAAALALAFVLAEAALGAGLVLFGLVEDDDSVARAVVVALHLVNTFCLLGFATLTAYWAGGGGAPRSEARGRWRAVLLAALAGTLVTSMAGAVTALGDTLFPVPVTQGGTWLQTIAGALPAGTHFLVRLRIVHPLLALALAVFLVVIAGRLTVVGPSSDVRRAARAVLLLVLVQIAIGLLTVLLSAPAWAQVAHLAFADLVWVALVLLVAASWRATADVPAPTSGGADAGCAVPGGQL